MESRTDKASLQDLTKQHQRLFDDTVRGFPSTSDVRDNGCRDVKADIEISLELETGVVGTMINSHGKRARQSDMR